MSSHDISPNDPKKEIRYTLGFLVMFFALVGWVFYGGWTRPAAPATLAETKKIIGLVDQPVKTEKAAPAAATETAIAPTTEVMAADMATATASSPAATNNTTPVTESTTVVNTVNAPVAP